VVCKGSNMGCDRHQVTMVPLEFVVTLTVVPPYPQVVCSKTYCSYMNLLLIWNAIYDMIFM
jgi:hypothetical protein